MKISLSAPYRGQPALTALWVAVLLAALPFTRGWAQAPPNDDFADRIPISLTNALTPGVYVTSIFATNTSATTEHGEPGYESYPAANSLWWDWTVQTPTGYAIVTTSNSLSPTWVAVYYGVKSLSDISANGDLETDLDSSGLAPAPDRFEFIAVNGTDYDIAVDSRNGDPGEVELDITLYTEPVIFAQPASTNFTAGQNGGISVTAVGSPPLSYQWQFSTLSQSAGFTNLPNAINSVLELPDVNDANKGWYRVVLSNSFSTDYGLITSESAYVEVNDCVSPNPLQPSAVATNVGTTVTFMGSALGTPPISFQWQFQPVGQQGFIDLPGATSSNLVLTNLSTDQYGAYQFQVSNIACVKTSSVVSLSVSTNNALVLNPNLPADQTVITNFNVTNLVSVTEGFQPIGYQWWSSNLASGQVGPLSGETGPVLLLPDVQVADAGLYWAVATNRYATITSRMARVTVQIRPPNDNFANRIPVFPDWTNLSTTVASQTNVSGFNQNATPEPGEPAHQGYGPDLSVWWSFEAPVDGAVYINLTAPDAPQVLAAYSGTNLTSLVPVVPFSSSLTNYVFVATNHIEYVFAVDAQVTSKYSTNINLSFTFNPNIGAPTIISQPIDFGWDYSVLGDPLAGCRSYDNFTVRASSLDGVVYYQWQFGPTTNGPLSDLPGMTNSTLVLTNVTTLNQGWYRTDVSNRSTNVYTAPVYLGVDVGPIIDTQPENTTTGACTTAQLQVVAESCSPMRYQWRLNGTSVNAANAQGANTPTLVISDTTPANAGNYDAVISNANNLSVTSSVATLTVLTNPVITAQPQSVSGHGCSSASFSVTAQANCALDYQWLFQNAPLPGATNSTHVIPSTEPSNAGSYSVIVSTPFASVQSQSASLTVQTEPGIQKPPVSVTNSECATVTLSVTVAAEPSCSFLAYQWQFNGTNILAATNSTYSFEASAETAGLYQVVVGNVWTNLIAGPARVTVLVTPQITAAPAISPSQVVLGGIPFVEGGTTFTNTITVQSCSDLSYLWLHAPPGGTNYSEVVLDADHQVATNGWLLVSSAQVSDSGKYYVIASNIYAGATSTVATVTVLPPPGNDDFANAFTLGSTKASGTGYNIFATAEPGEPNHGGQQAMHSVWWVWTNLSPSLITVSTSGSDFPTVLGVYNGSVVGNLNPVTEAASGSGPNGSAVANFMAGGDTTLYFAVDGENGAIGTNMISVMATPIPSIPPNITAEPLSLAASLGQTVTFTNEAYGSPNISIQWYGNGQPLAGLTTNIPAATPTNYFSTLTLTDITTNNEGNYYAVLSNNYGMVTTRVATLTFGSIVRGLVTDATETTTNGVAVGIPDALITAGNVSAYTDSNGNYELVGVALGSLHADFMADKTYAYLNEPIQFLDRSSSTASILTATKDGYYDYADDQFEVGVGQSVQQHIAMSPIFDGLRFVLTWTNAPADLDLWLQLPPSVPISYPWINYLPTNWGNASAPPFATNDAICTTGWGPDTISIHQFYPGTYSLYANKYQGQGNPLTQSDAQVTAYFGEDLSTNLIPYGIVHVPTVGTNEWWHICDIDGATTNITWTDVLEASPFTNSVGEPSPMLKVRGGFGDPPAAPRPLVVTNATYVWDFGDGTGTNDIAEPTHGYANPGWYSVTLQITENTGTPPKSDTMLKSNYIHVVDVPPTVTLTNPPQNWIIRAGDPIALQSIATSIDDVVTNVEYYLVSSQQTNYLGSASNAPYDLVFQTSATNGDSTNIFMALATDSHGVSSWSQPLIVNVLNLSGDILILSVSNSPEIEEMAADLSQMQITTFDTNGYPLLPRPAIIDTLIHTVLYFGLVQGFKLIVWDDQGVINPSLTDNDVSVLQQAYASGIPLYLIGEKLAGSINYLTNAQNFLNWSNLLGCQQIGSIPGPSTIQGIEVPYEDGLFYGYDPVGVASTNLPVSSTLEWLALTSTNFDVVAQVPDPGTASNSPIMLRYPHLSAPNFGLTPRLVQDFRVTLAVNPLPPQDAASSQDRQILFFNGAAWLLGLFGCTDFAVDFECIDPPQLTNALPDAQGNVPSGTVGQPITFTTTISQNGSCPPGGVLVSNLLSPQFQVVSASIIPLNGVPANTFQVTIASNLAVAQFSELLGNYQFVTVAIPLTNGWLTNTYTASQGKYYHAAPCSQVALIQAPTCANVVLSAYMDKDIVHLIVAGGPECSLELQGSTDLINWVDLVPVQPNSDPYDVQVAPASGVDRFYRLRQLP